ncbi:MAG: hypothetical protein L3J63_11865, partial [Geopsychrobacter sp.]|nr:hypothetical protein [Geopsychrobacter sp.]
LDGINPQAAAFATNLSQSQSGRSDSLTPNSEYEEKVTDAMQVRTIPGQDEIGADGRKRDSFELSQEAEEIRVLQARDREVRAHEAAHASAGGVYAGAPSFSFERGPDGQTYAIDGEVSINISPIAGDPQATLQKAQQVRAAALAPAEPSAQDMQVAQRAQALATTARMEISSAMTEELKVASEQTVGTGSAEEGEVDNSTAADISQGKPHSSNQTASPGFARLSIHV